MKQIELKNGCRCSRPVVSPATWETDKVITSPWSITYRFYQEKKVKQVVIKGMNHVDDIKQRRQITRELLAYELNLLINEGYNPLTKKLAEEKPGVIDENTPFIKAWLKALELIKVEPKTRQDIRNVITPCRKAAAKLNFLDIPIKDLSRRHIKAILQTCSEIQPKFTDNTFNHYRKYLSILYTELNELEVVQHDPITKIKRRKTVTKKRITLTDKEREKVKVHLQQYPAFYRFVQIFFHSGARISELLNLKVEQVDLEQQRFLCVIKKGKEQREVERTIKNLALPYWKEVLQLTKAGDFVFSKGLVPGANQIRPDQITKRWKRLVKEPLNIKADFYSLKHSNSTAMVDLLGEQAAADLNAHSGTGMVVKIYDTKNASRKHEALKKADNAF